MSEIGKKLNYPGTKQIGDAKTQRYARKLTRTLDDLKAQLMRSLKTYIDELVKNINIEIGTLDHGALTGLQDVEDHLYAFLIDASRAFTDHGPGFSNDTSLADASMYAAVSEYAIKAYVDALLAYILASPLGSIIYIWDDVEGDKKLERLIPGYYGQVLVTGGANQRPFWDWVWESPGAEGSPSIVYFLIVESSVTAAKIVPDYEVSESAAIDIVSCSNLGPDADWFEDYDPTLDTAVSAAKITPDHTANIDISGDMTLDIVFSPLRASVYDAIGVSDGVDVSVALNVSVYDAIGISDEAIASVL